MKTEVPWDVPRPNRYTITEWEVDPAKTALLLVDMQTGYLSARDGVGPGLKEHFPEVWRYYYSRIDEAVLDNAQKLQSFFRDHRLEVFYTRMGIQLPEGRDLPSWSWRRGQLGDPRGNLLTKGDAEYEITPALSPRQDELIFDKNSASPFASTAFNQITRNMGIENIVVAGVLTNVAVESTCRDAGDCGYNVIAIEDACAAYSAEDHQAALDNASWWVTKTTTEFINTFQPLLV